MDFTRSATLPLGRAGSTPAIHTLQAAHPGDRFRLAVHHLQLHRSGGCKVNFDQVKELMQFADVHIARLIKKDPNAKPPCCRGCFHCCREPVYATLSEVRLILSKLSDGERESLKLKLLEWRQKYRESGFVLVNLPNAFKYRALNLWCPFLSGGDCSIYEDRPISCRLHVAYESREGCEDDTLRKKQKFALFPRLQEVINGLQFDAMQIGESEVFESFQALLLQELLTPGKRSHVTASRVEFRKTAKELE